MALIDFFLDFVSYNTASDDSSTTVPSTDGQKVLGAHLVEVMKEIGITDPFMDEYGYVYGTIPATDERKNTVGFIAHMDTVSVDDKFDTKPRIIKEYDGNPIKLNENVIMNSDDFPSLLSHVGKSLIVTDGTTVLGGDDKAGIAEILAAADEIIKENKPHGTIKIAFTPDEEIGGGCEYFDVKGFGCDYAYTVDGGALGEIEYENFNAASAVVEIAGRSIHTGSAKGKMINASTLAMEYVSLLPAEEVPEHTENYEGFICLESIDSNLERATLKFLIRDHDMELFEKKKAFMQSVADFMNSKYPTKPVTVSIKDSYYNMKEKILPKMEIVDKMVEAMEENGATPIIIPIRGGTDGARLSYMGLPCPNICTGCYNGHGRYEYAVIEEMTATKNIIKTTIYNVE